MDQLSQEREFLAKYCRDQRVNEHVEVNANCIAIIKTWHVGDICLERKKIKLLMFSQ